MNATPIFKQLIKNLPEEDIRKLCATNSDFRQECNNNKDFIKQEIKRRRRFLVIDSDITMRGPRDWYHVVSIRKERPKTTAAFRDVFPVEIVDYNAKHAFVLFHFEDNYVDFHRVFQHEDEAEREFLKAVKGQLEELHNEGDSIRTVRIRGGLVSTLYDEDDVLTDLFLYGHGTPKRNLQFQAIVVGLVVMTLLTLYFPTTYGFVILLLVFAYLVASVFVKASNQRVNDYNRETMYRLQRLQALVDKHTIDQNRKFAQGTNLSRKQMRAAVAANQLDSVFINSGMIHFLFDIMPLQHFNPNAFVDILLQTNSLLRIQRQADDFFVANKRYPETIGQMFQQALQLRTQCLNSMHTFVYTVPKTRVMYKYIDDVTTRYHTLLSRITDTIHNMVQHHNRTQPINTGTVFVSYDTTKPFDAMSNHPISPHATHQQGALVDFYA